MIACYLFYSKRIRIFAWKNKSIANMFKKITSRLSEFIHKHHESISSFNVNFLATVLGIVLTFGTSMWYERQQKKEASNALVERCLKDMEGRLRVIDRIVESYNRHDSLYRVMQSHPLDSLDDDVLGSIIYEYTTQYNMIISHAYEKSFSQSVTSHDNLGIYAEVIGDGYEYLLYAEQHHDKINMLHAEIFRRHIMAENTYWVKGSMRAVVDEAIHDPYFVLYREEYFRNSRAVRHMQYVLSFYIPQARRLWQKEITLDEFIQTTEARWDSFNNE